MSDSPLPSEPPLHEATQASDGTDAAHMKRRNRQIKLASVMGVLFQATYALSQFVALAVLIRVVGAEQTGMWATIWPMTAWLLLGTFGLNNAIVTRLGKSALTDEASARITLATGLIAVASIAAILLLAVLLIAPQLDWATILNTQTEAASNVAGVVALIAFALAAVNIPFVVLGMVLLSYQRMAVYYGGMVLANGAVLLTLLIAWQYQMTQADGQRLSLVFFATVLMLPPLLGGLIAMMVAVVKRYLPKPSLRLFSFDELKGLLRTGLSFFVIELTIVVVVHAAPLIIAHVRDPEAVVAYRAVFQLAALHLALIQVCMFPFWPAFGEAMSRGEVAWLKGALIKSFGVNVGLWLVYAAGVLLLGKMVIGWWLGEDAVPNQALLLASIGYAGSYGLLVWMQMPLNGIGRLGSQVVSGVIMVVTFIPLAYFFGERFGATGVMACQAMLIFAVALPINGWMLRHQLQQASTKARKAKKATKASEA